MRVRDEIKMTIQAYQTLYESSIAYGMRKALSAEQNKAEKLLQLASLEKRYAEREDEINEWKRKIQEKLNEEKRSKEREDEEYKKQTQSLLVENQKKVTDLKEKLNAVQVGPV